MTWNVAYAHLADHVLNMRLADFNTQRRSTYGGMHRKKNLTIGSMDDINDVLMESQFLTTCRDATSSRPTFST